MNIKFAIDIAKDIENRGPVNIPEGYVTGEAYEEWLYKKDVTNLYSLPTNKNF
jgi:hypothetical protein